MTTPNTCRLGVSRLQSMRIFGHGKAFIGFGRFGDIGSPAHEYVMPPVMALSRAKIAAVSAPFKSSAILAERC
ncbi:hypothetical protein TRM7615_04400 [Falsiruegeria mediterranea M17]|uniref:Uncharacterized protein n=1 Tax=Falsiruegeria mediterranea M17 TaxID=1200281 RepID=A0A2R8CEJ8_9RHOB|nr:hypothetical protein TRM7615_04400 [Falsiruegeria mediterranea M17]